MDRGAEDLGSDSEPPKPSIGFKRAHSGSDSEEDVVTSKPARRPVYAESSSEDEALPKAATYQREEEEESDGTTPVEQTGKFS